MAFSLEDKRQLRSLLDALSDSTITDAQSQTLNAVVKDNSDARQFYVEYLLLDALLNWSLGKGSASGFLADDELTQVIAEKRTVSRQLQESVRSKHWFHRNSSSRLLAIAVTVLLVGYFVLANGSLIWEQTRTRLSRTDDSRRGPAAVLMNADDAQWRGNTHSKTQTLHVRTGVAELKFAKGAKVVVKGPAEFEVRSTNSGYLRRGKLVAAVPPRAMGFTVITPTVEVVELGTEFGVEVDDRENSEVHVFQGLVLAQLKSSGPRQAEVRIPAGKALRVGKHPTSNEVTNVPFNPEWRSEFAGKSKVHAVMLSAKANTGNTYRIVPGALIDGKRAYSEKVYDEVTYLRWVGVDGREIPRELIGADYLQTANADKHRANLELQIELGFPATLYVFHFASEEGVPEWLKRDFEPAGFDIGLSNPAGVDGPPGRRFTRFAVWKRLVEPGVVKLGPNIESGKASQYGVAAVPNFGKKESPARATEK
jgi:hypothetical protein